MRRNVLVAGIVSVFVGFGCVDDGGGSSWVLEDLRVAVDFDETLQYKANLASLTPSRYAITLCRLVLWNPTTNDRFEVFGHEDTAECPTFDFTAGTVDAMSLVPSDAALPDEPGYSVVEMDILHLEMDLDFYIQAAGGFESRSLRLYMSNDGAYRPGDLVVVEPENTSGNWVFGNGNVTDDPFLEGLPRALAYTLDEWPRGHSTDDWGPFGDAAFWENHPPDPFTWAVALPPDFGDSALITFEVADSWNFTDQNMDGEYDWPSDYGNQWHMAFPTIVATHYLETETD